MKQWTGSLVIPETPMNPREAYLTEGDKNILRLIHEDAGKLYRMDTSAANYHERRESFRRIHDRIARLTGFEDL